MSLKNVLFASVLMMTSTVVVAEKARVYSSLFGGAISGYDGDAYFTEGKDLEFWGHNT